MSTVGKNRNDKVILLNAKAYAQLHFGKTLEQVEIELGISEGYFKSVLDDKTDLSYCAAASLEDYLNVSISELLEMDGQLMFLDSEIKELEEKLANAKRLRESLIQQKQIDASGNLSVAAFTDKERRLLAKELWQCLSDARGLIVKGDELSEIEKLLCMYLGYTDGIQVKGTVREDAYYVIGRIYGLYPGLVGVPYVYDYLQKCIVKYSDFKKQFIKKLHRVY